MTIQLTKGVDLHKYAVQVKTTGSTIDLRKKLDVSKKPVISK